MTTLLLAAGIFVFATYLLPFLYFWDFRHKPLIAVFAVLGFYVTMFLIVPLFRFSLIAVFTIPPALFLALFLKSAWQKVEKDQHKGDPEEVLDDLAT